MPMIRLLNFIGSVRRRMDACQKLRHGMPVATGLTKVELEDKAAEKNRHQVGVWARERGLGVAERAGEEVVVEQPRSVRPQNLERDAVVPRQWLVIHDQRDGHEPRREDARDGGLDPCIRGFGLLFNRHLRANAHRQNLRRTGRWLSW